MGGMHIHEGDPDRRELAAEALRKNIQRSHVRCSLKQGERLNPAYVYRLWLEDPNFANELAAEGLIPRTGP
jgi:hypothetical protein